MTFLKCLSRTSGTMLLISNYNLLNGGITFMNVFHKTRLKVKLNAQAFAALNYAQQYEQALQQVYTSELRFNRLYTTPNNSLIKWTGAKTIQVPSISTGGFVDVNRDALSGYTRRVDNSFTTYTLEHDREFKTLVDPMDIDETNMALTIANITRVFNTEHKIPEMDKYLASKLLSEFTTKNGVADNTVLTKTNILEWFDLEMQKMDDAEVPLEGRVLYLTPAMHTAIKQAEQIERSLDVRGAGTGVNRTVRSLDSVELIPVPSARMKSAYDFTDGAVPAVSAKQINAILIHPGTVYTPQKYDFVSLDAPTANTSGKYLYYERKYWDVFVIPQKVKGISINVEA